MATTNSNFKVKNGLDAGGTITATTFSGSGASLTSLNGSNISSGTVADARIASTIARTSSVNLKLDKTIQDPTYYDNGIISNLFSVQIYEDPYTEKLSIDNLGRLNLTNSQLSLVSTPLVLSFSPIRLGSSDGNVGQVLTSAGAGNVPTWGLTQTALSTGFSIAGGTTSKTLTVNRTLTLTGTDSTTMTFPSTSATIARTDSGQTFSGTQVIDTINAASSSSTTADLFGNVTTGTVGIADGLTTGTLNIGNGTTSSTGRTVNINTNASGLITVTTNIGSSTIGGKINLISGSSGGVVLNGNALITTPAAVATSSLPLSISTGQTSTSGNSGNLVLDVGIAAGTAGTVSIGGLYTSAVSVSRTGVTTTILGPLALSGTVGGYTMTGSLVGPTTTTSLAPIRLPSGTVPTTASQQFGMVAADAESLQLSTTKTTGAGPGFGIVRAPQMVFSLANAPTSATTTTGVAAFAAANDVLSSLEANKLYRFRGKYYVTYTAGGTAGALQMLFAFANAPQAINYNFRTTKSTSATTMNQVGIAAVATGVSVSTSDQTSGTLTVEFDGYFTSNATTGGTLTPQIAASVASLSGGSFVVTTGSWFEVEKIGSATQTLIAGNWA